LNKEASLGFQLLKNKSIQNTSVQDSFANKQEGHISNYTKLAQFMSNGPGRPETDPFIMPEIGETQGHAQKRNSIALQKTCHTCQSTCAPDASNCPQCGTKLKNPYSVPRQPTMRAAQVGTYMVNPPANRNVRGPSTESFERRRKRPHYPILPSDDFADVGNEDHMKQVQESASALGLD